MRGRIPSPRLDHEVRLGRAQAGRIFRRSMAGLRPYRMEAALGVAVMVGTTACTVAPPLLFKYAVDHGLAAGHRRVLDEMAALAVLVAVAGYVLSRAQIIVVTRVGEKFLRDLRSRAFDHLLSMSLGFFDHEQTGRLVSRMTSDIDTMEDLVQQGLVLFVTNILLFMVTLAVMLYVSPVLTLVCLVTVPPVAIATIRFRRSSNRAYLMVRDTVSQTMSTLQEGLSGVRVVQAFTREASLERLFGVHNRAQRDANIEAARISSWYFPVIEGSGVLTTAAVIGVGGVLVHQGTVTVGAVGAFTVWLLNLFDPIQQLSQLFNIVQSAGAGLAKLYTLLDTQTPVRERPGAIDLPARGSLVLDNVSFSYAPHLLPVVGCVSLVVAAGERLALVGPTGAGKSTLAKLMARFYDPDRGSVAFGGLDLRSATLFSLRERIVVVPQEGHLFGGTIADNIRLGRADATDDEVEAALRRMEVYERFAALPDGLATDVRQGGSRLSAGERQMISLARAFLCDPRVLILDEATSSLDPGTETELESAVALLMAGRTVIVVAHRLSTAQRADRVAVVDSGGVVELGTHDELLALGGRYSTLFSSWQGGLAAAN